MPVRLKPNSTYIEVLGLSAKRISREALYTLQAYRYQEILCFSVSIKTLTGWRSWVYYRLPGGEVAHEQILGLPSPRHLKRHQAGSYDSIAQETDLLAVPRRHP